MEVCVLLFPPISKSSVSSRFSRWTKGGVWVRVSLGIINKASLVPVLANRPIAALQLKEMRCAQHGLHRYDKGV